LADKIHVEWKWASSSEEENLRTDIVTQVELTKLLDNIRSESQERKEAISVVTYKNDNSLSHSIIVGLEKGAILTAQRLDGEPPNYISINETSDSNNMVLFTFMGETSELPDKFVIPLEDAIEANLDGLDKDEPSPLIHWLSDNPYS